METPSFCITPEMVQLFNKCVERGDYRTFYDYHKRSFEELAALLKTVDLPKNYLVTYCAHNLMDCIDYLILAHRQHYNSSHMKRFFKDIDWAVSNRNWERFYSSYCDPTDYLIRSARGQQKIHIYIIEEGKHYLSFHDRDSDVARVTTVRLENRLIVCPSETQTSTSLEKAKNLIVDIGNTFSKQASSTCSAETLANTELSCNHPSSSTTTFRATQHMNKESSRNHIDNSNGIYHRIKTTLDEAVKTALNICEIKGKDENGKSTITGSQTTSSLRTQPIPSILSMFDDLMIILDDSKTSKPSSKDFRDDLELYVQEMRQKTTDNEEPKNALSNTQNFPAKLPEKEDVDDETENDDEFRRKVREQSERHRKELEMKKEERAERRRKHEEELRIKKQESEDQYVTFKNKIDLSHRCDKHEESLRKLIHECRIKISRLLRYFDQFVNAIQRNYDALSELNKDDQENEISCLLVYIKNTFNFLENSFEEITSLLSKFDDVMLVNVLKKSIADTATRLLTIYVSAEIFLVTASQDNFQILQKTFQDLKPSMIFSTSEIRRICKDNDSKSNPMNYNHIDFPSFQFHNKKLVKPDIKPKPSVVDAVISSVDKLKPSPKLERAEQRQKLEETLRKLDQEKKEELAQVVSNFKTPIKNLEHQKIEAESVLSTPPIVDNLISGLNGPTTSRTAGPSSENLGSQVLDGLTHLLADIKLDTTNTDSEISEEEHEEEDLNTLIQKQAAQHREQMETIGKKRAAQKKELEELNRRINKMTNIINKPS